MNKLDCLNNMIVFAQVPETLIRNKKRCDYLMRVLKVITMK